MTIYVDGITYYGEDWPMSPQTRRASPTGAWSHMTTNQADVTELHEMASKIGMKRSWFQDKPGFPHYDLVPSKRAAALKAGAVETSTGALVKMRRKVR